MWRRSRVGTLSEAAERIGAHLSAVSRVLGGERRNPRIQAGIARLCGCAPKDLFGGWTHPTLADVAAAPAAHRRRESA